MSTQKLYDQWSTTYDTVENKTRDLEKIACETVLAGIQFARVIELGGGTGKNTPWFASRADHVISIDFSAEMQAVAKAKVENPNVEFRLGDVRKEWQFADFMPDLVTCSLILEHVKDLGFVFQQAKKTLSLEGHFYICELHPFKQYEGSKARFETKDGTQVTECFQHHITDYTRAALANDFVIARMDEWFDNADRITTPRLVSFLFRKA